MNCEDCKGTGRDTCPGCCGTGREYSRGICIDCAGRGSFTCFQCKGSGEHHLTEKNLRDKPDKLTLTLPLTLLREKNEP